MRSSELFGDSSYVVHYLLALGYRMPDFEQTGSNFGADLEHENPFLIDVGRGTMIADGATLIDADYTSTSFRVGMFDGTPFKGPVWRLVGVQVGRRLFDDGCSVAERTLVRIGDDCTLNAGSVIQCHSMEDGIFKSDYTVVEDGCTIGAGALVHYGVTMGQGSRLRPDSFLMKGESVPSQARWGGNPARALD